MTGNNELRAVRPEAEITLNSVDYKVGGTVGQSINQKGYKKQPYIFPEITEND